LAGAKNRETKSQSLPGGSITASGPCGDFGMSGVSRARRLR
jgi:hypothetical protein